MTEANPSKLAPFSTLSEPPLTFDGDSTKAVDEHPLRGLATFGPFTGSAFGTFTASIRVAIVGPDLARDKRRDLLRSLRDSHPPKDRRDYVPPYPGFAQLFGVNIVPAAPEAQLTIPERLHDLPDGDSPQARVQAAIARIVRDLNAVRDRFDVAVVHLPDAWEPGLRGEGFDAHDELKALAAQFAIATQVLNDRTFSFPYRASLAWRLSIALYVKAGGVPWKLSRIPGVPEGTAYIGLSYAFRGDPRHAKYVTCCSQVFDEDGGGMQFVAYDARDEIDDLQAARRNPYLSRSDMRSVLARSLLVYQRRNGGSIPRRVVIHKNTAFRPEELAGAADALEAVDEMECVEVTTNVAWRGVTLRAASHPAPGRASEPDRYPVRRGIMVPLTGTSALLWGAGNAPSVSASGNFYQGAKSIPTPLLLTRHAGQGPLELMAAEVLALTKMDWNNDALYDPVPVTLRYSQRLARTIANVPSLRREEYPYRLFM